MAGVIWDGLLVENIIVADWETVAFFLESEEAIALCQTFDRLCEMYISQIKLIEESWKSNRFEVSSVPGAVPIMEIEQNLWNNIFRYAKEQEGKWKDNWSLVTDHWENDVFVCEGREGNNCVAAILSRLSSRNGIHTGIVWHSPNRSDLLPLNNQFGQYWDADAACTWLTNTLIPRVTYEMDIKKSRRHSLLSRLGLGYKKLRRLPQQISNS